MYVIGRFATIGTNGASVDSEEAMKSIEKVVAAWTTLLATEKAFDDARGYSRDYQFLKLGISYSIEFDLDLTKDLVGDLQGPLTYIELLSKTNAAERQLTKAVEKANERFQSLPKEDLAPSFLIEIELGLTQLNKLRDAALLLSQELAQGALKEGYKGPNKAVELAAQDATQGAPPWLIWFSVGISAGTAIGLATGWLLFGRRQYRYR